MSSRTRRPRHDSVLSRSDGVTSSSTGSCAIVVGSVVVLLVLGIVLAYVTLPYLDHACEPVTGRPRLLGAAGRPRIDADRSW